MNKQVIVTSGPIVLSEKATEFLNTPAPLMNMVEDIYTIGDGKAWVVVGTQGQKEDRVAKGLAEAGISTFLPKETATINKTTEFVEYYPYSRVVRCVRKKTKRTVVVRPLLPNYIFVEAPTRYDPATKKASFLPVGPAKILRIEGVHGILGSAETGPQPIPKAFVELLQRKQSKGEFDRTKQEDKWAKPGMITRVIDGPFASFDAVVHACLPNDIVEVAVSLFGRENLIKLELAQLDKVC